MKTLLVKTGTPYEIKIERGLLRRAGDEIRRIPELRGARKAAVVPISQADLLPLLEGRLSL